MTEQNDSLTLSRLPANRKVVDFLFTRGFISHAGREMALEWLYPHDDWRFQVSIITRLLGSTFIIAALIYYFVHNWQYMSTAYKFFTIELALALAVLASVFYNNFNQKLAMTITAILMGMLLAFYAQTYPTSAQTYVYFAIWALFISPWVLLSQFAFLWIGWIVVLNFALGFYLDQALNLNHHWIRLSLLILNVIFLGLREYGYHQGLTWLHGTWHRYALLIPIILLALFPIEIQIAKQDYTTIALPLSAAVAWLTLLGLTFYYAKQDKNMGALSLLILTLCFALGSLWVRVVMGEVQSKVIELTLCTLGVFCIFTTGAYFLKRTSYHRYLQDELAYGHTQHE